MVRMRTRKVGNPALRSRFLSPGPDVRVPEHSREGGTIRTSSVDRFRSFTNHSTRYP